MIVGSLNESHLRMLMGETEGSNGSDGVDPEHLAEAAEEIRRWRYSFKQHGTEIVGALRIRRNWYVLRGHAVPKELELAYRCMAAVVEELP